MEEDQVVEEDQVCGGGSSLWRRIKFVEEQDGGKRMYRHGY